MGSESGGLRTRVQAIALIHERLYQSRDYAHAPFAQ
jgi:two-component sensor histidine kinase